MDHRLLLGCDHTRMELEIEFQSRWPLHSVDILSSWFVPPVVEERKNKQLTKLDTGLCDTCIYPA
jgi:hypothetical protein